MVEHLTLNQGVQGSSPWRRMEVPIFEAISGVGAFFCRLLITAGKENIIKPINVSTEHFVFRSHPAVGLRNRIIRVPHEHTQELQVTAAHQVGRREGVPEQVRMQPFYAA